MIPSVDPQGADLALRQVVLIGHSQGGLLTKLQAVGSDNRFWANVSEKKLEDLDLDEAPEKLLRDALFFERVPLVRRVIFLATPHRGSFLAGNWAGRLPLR